MNWSDFLQSFTQPFNIFVLVLIVLVLFLLFLTFSFKVSKKDYKKDKAKEKDSLRLHIKGINDEVAKLKKDAKEQEKFNNDALILFNLKTDILQSFNRDFEEEILEALYLIPNKKFTAAIADIDKNWNDRKEEIQKKISTKFDEVEKEIKSKNQKIEELNLKIKEQEELLKKHPDSVKKVKIKIKKE